MPSFNQSIRADVCLVTSPSIDRAEFMAWHFMLSKMLLLVVNVWDTQRYGGFRSTPACSWVGRVRLVVVPSGGGVFGTSPDVLVRDDVVRHFAELGAEAGLLVTNADPSELDHVFFDFQRPAAVWGEEPRQMSPPPLLPPPRSAAEEEGEGESLLPPPLHHAPVDGYFPCLGLSCLGACCGLPSTPGDRRDRAAQQFALHKVQEMERESPGVAFKAAVEYVIAQTPYATQECDPICNPVSGANDKFNPPLPFNPTTQHLIPRWLLPRQRRRHDGMLREVLGQVLRGEGGVRAPARPPRHGLGLPRRVAQSRRLFGRRRRR